MQPSVRDIAEDVRSGRRTAVDVVQAHLDHIAADVERLGRTRRGWSHGRGRWVRRGRRVLRFGGPRPAVAAAWRERATAWFADHDVLVSPAVARLPGPAGALAETGYLRTWRAQAQAVPYTPAWNLAGLPAVVVPVGERDGFPLAVQLVGPPASERLLLTVAALIAFSSA